MRKSKIILEDDLEELYEKEDMRYKMETKSVEVIASELSDLNIIANMPHSYNEIDDSHVRQLIELCYQMSIKLYAHKQIIDELNQRIRYLELKNKPYGKY